VTWLRHSICDPSRRAAVGPCGNRVADPGDATGAPGLLYRALAAGFCLCFAIVAAACGPLQLPAATPDAASAVSAPVPVAPPAPRRVALLVPLSGPQRQLGESIRDGFLAARLAGATGTADADVMVLDELAPDAASACAAALAAGAEAIVGPLLKESVAAVAPVAGNALQLALNTLEPGAAAPARFYQFGLLPEDEAEQAAIRAAAEGRLRAVGLAPDTDWGRRVLGAFAPAIEARGGTLLAFRFYNPTATDYTAQLERLLGVDESRARHRAVTRQVGTTLEFEPQRRTDVDVIFLAATPTTGRMLRPQLRFVYAGDLPVLATSAIHQPGSGGDADLDGIAFPDAPAVIGTDPRSERLRMDISSHWPGGGISRLRFFAMGHDAWHVASSLATGGSGELDGLSGRLSVDAGGRVRRELAWGAYRDGMVVPLPTLVSPPASEATNGG
jgi:outer membrane PBP1 activator LpoA protein